MSMTTMVTQSEIFIVATYLPKDELLSLLYKRVIEMNRNADKILLDIFQRKRFKESKTHYLEIPIYEICIESPSSIRDTVFPIPGVEIMDEQYRILR